MKCPTCGQEIVWKGNEFRPFCSERCKLIDFGNWANEEYRVPAEDRPTPDQIDPRDPEALDEHR